MSNRSVMMGQTALAMVLAAGIAAVPPTAHAEESDLYDDFSGVTVRAKLIGGAQYAPLYNVIAEWEELTGATVQILSQQNHFDLDREIKQDIAAGTVDWCVGSNHTSFAPQYGDLYVDLNEHLPEDVIAQFVPRVIDHATVDGRLVQLPRHSDISNLYYIRSVFDDPDNQAEFEEEYGYPLEPPETWDQVRDMAMFFADPPNFFGFQYVGQDEAVTGRFYEMLVAEGGEFLDDGMRPAFNSEHGVRALDFFVDLYEQNAVPTGVPNYLWDDTGLGFASGSIAMNLDWAGWSAFFNDPNNSAIAGDVGIVRAPMGSAGIRTGWSGSHSFSVTENCENKDAAVSLIWHLTSRDSQMVEAETGLLPTREVVWDDAIEYFGGQGNAFMVEVFETYQEAMAEDAFTPPLIPEWIEVSNVLWPELQAAIVGDRSSEEALNRAAEAADEVMQDAGYY